MFATLSLAAFHDEQFLLWRSACKDYFGVVAKNIVQLTFLHVLQLLTVHYSSLGVKRVHLFHGNAQSCGNIIHRLGAFGNDAHRLCDRLCSDRMVTCHHDYLYSRRTALGNLKKYSKVLFVSFDRDFVHWSALPRQAPLLVEDQSWTLDPEIASSLVESCLRPGRMGIRSGICPREAYSHRSQSRVHPSLLTPGKRC